MCGPRDLSALARRSYSVNPILPVPFSTDGPAELRRLPSDTDDSSSPGLAVENDTSERFDESVPCSGGRLTFFLWQTGTLACKSLLFGIISKLDRSPLK